MDDLGNWNNPSREAKTEMPKHEREAGLTAPDPPVVASPPAGAKPDRTERERERTATYASPEPASAASDDRYPAAATAGAEREHRRAATVSSEERRANEASRAVVVQVSDGEPPDRARRFSENHEERGRPDPPIQHGPGMAATDGMGPERSGASEGRVGEAAVDPWAARRSHVGAPRPSEPDARTATIARLRRRATICRTTMPGPPGDAPSSYAAVPAGYASEKPAAVWR